MKKLGQSITIIIVMLGILCLVILVTQQNAMSEEAYNVWVSFTTVLVCLAPVLIVGFVAIAIVAALPYIYKGGGQ